MSGSTEERRVGLGLIVPAVTLVVPTILLLLGLLLLAPTPTPATVIADPLLVAYDEGDTLLTFATEAAAPTLHPVAPATVIAAIGTPVTPTPFPRPAATATPRELWVGPSTFTFVALGIDARNEKEIPRTDTIMIGKVDLRAARVNLVSVPRDLLVDIPGYGKDRINTAYVYGEQFKEPDGGIGLLQRTIEKSFGIKIDHFGMLDFQCFRTAVDSLGGVTVNVPRAIVDSDYPTEDYGTKIVRFDPGVQVMDGERALEYARTRYADNDFQRMQRQQLIVSAMREQALQLRTLPAVPTLLGGCRNMRSDLGWRDYLTLATSLRTLDSSRISFAAINEKMVTDSVLSSGASVLLPHWEAIREMLGESFGLAGTNPSANSGTRATSASPTPALPNALPTPFPSPLPANGSVAGPSLPDALTDVLPGDATPPALQPSGRS